MRTWSRGQSQGFGLASPKSSGLKVTALGNLEPLSEKQKRQLRRENGTRQRFAIDTPRVEKFKASRDYLCPMKADYVPPKPRGRSHVRMGGDARRALMLRALAREKFFESISGE